MSDVVESLPVVYCRMCSCCERIFHEEKVSPVTTEYGDKREKDQPDTFYRSENTKYGTHYRSVDNTDRCGFC